MTTGGIKMRAKILLTCALALSASFVFAQPFQEGTHYVLIDPPQPTARKNKVEVIEAFSYSCGHCNQFQAFVVPWADKLPDSVDFQRLPAVFRASWEPLARAYYVAEILDVLERMHPLLFKAVHEKHMRFRGADDMAAFFETHGIAKADFMAAYNSFAVETKIRRAETMYKRYGVTGTPSVIIGGKYRTNATMAGGSYPKLMALIESLIDKEHQEIAAKG